jgi:DNA repair exonuclease SbcCD ATPase subunit
VKIVSLMAENFKRLVAVEITPTGNVVQITGKNANGKSSCLDAISVALEGLEVCPGEPIRKGEKKAQIRVKLAGERELTVTRKFARKEEGGYTSSLTVESADGAMFKSPQKLLDELLGELAFDPLEFTRMKSGEQYDSMRSFVPGVDFKLIDAQNLADYNRRTEVNRQVKQAEAAADIIIVPQDTPVEPIDEQALADELKAAGILNADVERRKALRVQAAKDVENYRDQAQRTLDKIAPELEEINQRLNAALSAIDEQIATLNRQREALLNQSDPDFQAAEKKLRDEAAEFTRKADELQARLASAEKLPDIVDVDAITERMSRARIINANVERARQKAAHQAVAAKYQAESKALTEAMEARTAAKDQAIANAKMPVAGLGFGDGEVLLNGVPFAQASSAEQLRTSCAIAMAKNPTLRVCFIRDGSLLDEDGMKLIADLAEQLQFQIFVEKVDSTGKLGFVIEDGHVRQADAAGERSAA